MSLLHMRTMVLHPDFEHLSDFMQSLPDRFARNEGTVIHDGRNQLRLINFEGTDYVVKSFHRPHIINQLVYGTLRESKAKRSYDHAQMLMNIGVGSPRPVGYMNIHSGILFDKSFLVTLRSECPYVYTDLFRTNIPYEEEVLRAIGRQTALMHEHGYMHKDYSRGNILFRKDDSGIHLELIDLNRMRIGKVDIKAGCRNFERLPAKPQMHRWMAEEYAVARGFDVEECYNLMVAYRQTQSDKIDGLY